MNIVFETPMIMRNEIYTLRLIIAKTQIHINIPIERGKWNYYNLSNQYAMEMDYHVLFQWSGVNALVQSIPNRE